MNLLKLVCHYLADFVFSIDICEVLFTEFLPVMGGEALYSAPLGAAVCSTLLPSFCPLHSGCPLKGVILRGSAIHLTLL